MKRQKGTQEDSTKSLPGFVERIPVIGGLFSSSVKSHGSAALEMVLTLLFSFLPVLVAVLGDYLVKNLTLSGITDSLRSQVKNGELFIYSTSLAAPVFYLVLKKRSDDSTFPDKIAFLLLFCLIILVSMVAFAFQRATQVDPIAIYKCSLWVFFPTVVILYLVTLYSNALSPSAVDEAEKQTTQYSTRYREHRRRADAG